MYFDLLYKNICYILYSIYKGTRKANSNSDNMVNLVTQEIRKPKVVVWFDMVRCYLKYGATFREYYNLSFYKRSDENRATFMTTGSNIRARKITNNKSLCHIFINKDEFNHTYSDFINREWISLNDSFENVKSFFNRQCRVIVKLKNGDSGKGIFIVEHSDTLDDDKIKKIITENKNSIAEEVLQNHEIINKLNNSSLNTIRIITVLEEETVNFLYAGIRVGAKGSAVDNISMGGGIAPIDIETGKIIMQLFYKKSTVRTLPTSIPCVIGFQIPDWAKVKNFTERVAKVIPAMRYMAWDIALTPKGPALIEGNHSSGNTINQVHIGINDKGLKVRLDPIIKSIQAMKHEKK